MRHTLALLAILIGSNTAHAIEPAGGQSNKAEAQNKFSTLAIDNAKDKAMAWLITHPATVDDNELMEVVEEIMFYYALNSMSNDKKIHESYLREITNRHEAIVAFNKENMDRRLRMQGDWAALTYPPLAYIIATMGLKTDSYRAIIEDIISRQLYPDPSRNAMQLWIAIYLERLDYTPIQSSTTLLNNSSLQQDPETQKLLAYFRDKDTASEDTQATIQLIYNITHEIIALTDFGALQPPPVMNAQRDHYARLIDAAIVWATHESAIDALAELIYCAHLLNLGELPSLSAALDLIIENQQEDGSFGITNPDRPNGKRHGVLTCLLALNTIGRNTRT
jgi:hypothetical protein